MNPHIVGIGTINALGHDVASTWEALLAGRSGIRNIERFDASTFPVRFAAEAPYFRGIDGPELYDKLLDAALDEALSTVDLTAIRPERIGVYVGAEAIRPHLPRVHQQWKAGEQPEVGEVARHHPHRMALRAAMRVRSRGPVVTLSIACTSSAQACGDALQALRRGEIDVALVAGVDVLVHPLMVLGFSRLGALSTRNSAPQAASRPFDKHRDGFVLGDGAGVMVLAAPHAAIGAPIGRVLGYASTSNAWRITDTPPDGRGTRVALNLALQDAGIEPSALTYINAHGTSTPQNDASEARGLRDALGDAADVIPVSSTKSSMGHSVAACGVIEAIVALQAARHRIAPPTLNLDDPDPDCPIHHIPKVAVEIRSGPVATNAAGFGGSNTTIVLDSGS